MIYFLSLYFLKNFSSNTLNEVKNRSTLLSKTLCHFTPPPVCQNDTVYKLNQNLLYHYFFLFCNKRIRQLCYSCGGFNTPTLCVVTKGIKADCNHLMRTTYHDACVEVCLCFVLCVF